MKKKILLVLTATILFATGCSSSNGNSSTQSPSKSSLSVLSSPVQLPGLNGASIATPSVTTNSKKQPLAAQKTAPKPTTNIAYPIVQTPSIQSPQITPVPSAPQVPQQPSPDCTTIYNTLQGQISQLSSLSNAQNDSTYVSDENNYNSLVAQLTALQQENAAQDAADGGSGDMSLALGRQGQINQQFGAEELAITEAEGNAQQAIRFDIAELQQEVNSLAQQAQATKLSYENCITN